MVRTVAGARCLLSGRQVAEAILTSMKGRDYAKSANANDPGPGAYTPINPNFVSPKWSMTGRGEMPTWMPPQRRQVRRTIAPRSLERPSRHDARKAEGPGWPGCFHAWAGRVHNIFSVKPKPPAFSLQARTEYAPMSARTPGPAEYSLGEVRSTISFSMTPRRDLKTGPAVSTPGPAAYEIPAAKSRYTRLGVGPRFTSAGPAASTPGPAGYTPDIFSTKPKPSAFSLIPRRDELKSSSINPGPGAYTPVIDAMKPKALGFTLLGRVRQQRVPHRQVPRSITFNDQALHPGSHSRAVFPSRRGRLSLQGLLPTTLPSSTQPLSLGRPSTRSDPEIHTNL